MKRTRDNIWIRFAAIVVACLICIGVHNFFNIDLTSTRKFLDMTLWCSGLIVSLMLILFALSKSGRGDA